MKKTLAYFQPLKPAEQKLLECCQSGKAAIIGKERPTEKAEANEIRAQFLRWLILTKEIEIDPMGIQVKGAWMSSELNLEDVNCFYTLGFNKCVFKETLILRKATIHMFYADGSLFEKGILADGLICNCNVHLRNGFQANDEVRLVGAKIAGNFDCATAIFTAIDAKRPAFCCNAVLIMGGMLFDQNSKIIKGYLDLAHANIGALSSDDAFWQQESLKTVYLDGFKYGHIYGNTNAFFLLKNMLGKMLEFKPQPYKQLAKVLREMGHDRDADEVIIALNDKRLTAQTKASFRRKINNSKKEFIILYLVHIIGALISYIFRKVYKWTSAYGYRPMRAFGILVSIWFLFGCIYWYGANVAVFAPTNPLIFQKNYNCTIDKNGTPWFASPKDYSASNNWYEASPPEYTTFQPFWYSLDIILPVVDLKMENDWGVVIPSPDGSFFKTFNYFVRILTWSENLIGWILSLLLVAILSGLAKNEKE